MRGGVSTTEKSNRRSNKYAFKERLLQSHFSSPEEDRRMATSDRPVSSESVCSLSSFQNGDIELNQVSTSERRLGNKSGSPRCIFSYRHSPSITSLSSFCFRRQGLPVPGLSFWPECQSVSVYSDVINSTQAREAPRYSGSRLPGRLVTTFCLRNPIMASQQKASEDYSGTTLHFLFGRSQN